VGSVGTTGADSLSAAAGNNSWLVGLDGNDAIAGNTGNDVLQGGVGNDSLTGGGGNDTYVFGRGDGHDVIVNGAAGNTGPTGELDFTSDIASNQLWFKQAGNDLIVQVMGTQDQVTVSNWFGATTAQTQEIKAAGGLEIDAGVASLVQAMATYSSNNSAFNPTTSATQAPSDPALQGAIATAWHH